VRASRHQGQRALPAEAFANEKKAHLIYSSIAEMSHSPQQLIVRKTTDRENGNLGSIPINLLKIGNRPIPGIFQCLN
jgi:hypothetical protein